MIPIGSIVKWAAIATIFSGIIYAGSRIYEYHLDEIDEAVNTAILESAAETQRAVTAREEEVRKVLDAEREVVEKELVVARNKAVDLERMLLIDHDLDRLLQRKPGLILPIVNEGTVEVLAELEELTQ